jgi:hypothetical protein
MFITVNKQEQQMATISRSNISTIRADVEAALRTVYAKHGIDITVGRITFTANDFRCKITGVVRGAAGTSTAAPVDPTAFALTRAAYQLGNNYKAGAKYHSTSLGKIEIVGYNSKAKKYPFIVKVVANGKKYKVSSSSAKAAVEAGAVA